MKNIILEKVLKGINHKENVSTNDMKLSTFLADIPQCIDIEGSYIKEVDINTIDELLSLSEDNEYKFMELLAKIVPTYRFKDNITSVQRIQYFKEEDLF